MSPGERAAIRGVLERVPDAIADWSEGLARLEPYTVVEADRPLASLSQSGGGRWWAGPQDCADDLRHAARGRYDSVMVLWPSDGGVPLCGWGCTIGPTSESGGAGFSSITSDHWRTLATDPDPEQGYVHEWLHQVEATYRALGVGHDRLPDLHAAGDHTSCRAATEPPFGGTYGASWERSGTWAPWYRDYMTGRLRPLGTSRCIGLGPEVWALRGR